MEVSVISNLMTLVHCAVNEVGPSFRMPAKNEKGRFDAVFGERVENAWSRIGIRAVVESQGDFLFFGRQMTHHRAENKTVSVERAVYRATDHAESECCWENHFNFFAPSTPA